MRRNLRSTSIQRRALAALALALVAASGGLAAEALTPAFTYQGELRSAGSPAHASFDMQFRLYDAEAGGSQIGLLVTRPAVPVTGGLFSVPLDFGPAQFAGERQWLEIAIRPAGGGTYETLSPRTEVTAAPYAWSAAVALANSVTTTSIVDGNVGAADIDAAQVQRRVAASCAAGQYIRAVAQDGTVTCGTDANSGGTVASITTGAGLTGGPITASGTISVAPGGIGTTEINPAQVQRRVSGSCAVGSHVRQVNEDGTVVCGTDAAGTPGWSLTGDAGTNPATNFIGTTDAQPLIVRTRNAQSLRIEPSDVLYNGQPVTANVIAGSPANAVSATTGVRGATVSGGGLPAGYSDPLQTPAGAPNLVTDHYGTVGGGYANRAGNADAVGSNEPAATVGGGAGNTAASRGATVAGGRENHAAAELSTIAGGDRNQVSGAFGAVGGGGSNGAIGMFSTVSGGNTNTASGEFSAVSGGFANCAGGDYSWAGGSSAYIRPGTDPARACAFGTDNSGDANGDEGTFVWAGSTGSQLTSTGPNRFIVRATGGVWFGTNALPNIPSGQFIATSTGAHLTTGGTWTNASSRALKTAFESIDAGEVLARLLALPLTRWRYRDSPAEGVHLGPVAEDFHAAFGLGADGRSVSTVDASGVALAAIQGLNAKLEAE